MDKFQIGDKIRVIRDHETWLDRGQAWGAVFTATSAGYDFCEKTFKVDIATLNEWPDDFELVSREGRLVIDYVPERAMIDKEVIIPITRDKSEPLGVYRPNLEDRKVGKVRVELVDDGFPLALREIAKVMTWAQTAKGYKDHDWQNLPNPEQGLAAATSRHRTDHIIQRQVDKSAAIECTDHESEILHKAHEAFGVLAQLELILRGVIK